MLECLFLLGKPSLSTLQSLLGVLEVRTTRTGFRLIQAKLLDIESGSLLPRLAKLA